MKVINKVLTQLPEGAVGYVKNVISNIKGDEIVPSVNNPVKKDLYKGSISLLMHGTGFLAYMEKVDSSNYLMMHVGTTDKKLVKVPSEFKVDVLGTKITISSVGGTRQSLGDLATQVVNVAPYNPNTKNGISRVEVPNVPKSKSTSKGGAGGKK